MKISKCFFLEIKHHFFTKQNKKENQNAVTLITITLEQLREEKLYCNFQLSEASTIMDGKLFTICVFICLRRSTFFIYECVYFK